MPKSIYHFSGSWISALFKGLLILFLLWTSELLTSHLGRVPSRVTSHEGQVRVESRVTEISARVESSHESQRSRVRVESSHTKLSSHAHIYCLRPYKINKPERDRMLSVYDEQWISESKIKISLSIIYSSYFNLLGAGIFQIGPIPFRRSLNDQDLPVAKWLERDSTWLVRVKGSNPSRVASLRGPWLEVKSRVTKMRLESRLESNHESRVNTSGGHHACTQYSSLGSYQSFVLFYNAIIIFPFFL